MRYQSCHMISQQIWLAVPDIHTLPQFLNPDYMLVDSLRDSLVLVGPVVLGIDNKCWITFTSRMRPKSSQGPFYYHVTRGLTVKTARGMHVAISTTEQNLSPSLLNCNCTNQITMPTESLVPAAPSSPAA